jgi:hypothetical protein
MKTPSKWVAAGLCWANDWLVALYLWFGVVRNPSFWSKTFQQIDSSKESLGVEVSADQIHALLPDLQASVEGPVMWGLFILIVFHGWMYWSYVQGKKSAQTYIFILSFSGFILSFISIFTSWPHFLPLALSTLASIFYFEAWSVVRLHRSSHKSKFVL